MAAESEKKTSSKSWIENLQVKIYEIILKVIDLSHTEKLLDDYAMRNYWVKAFTHKSVDPANSYELFEFYGDKTVNYAFSMYVRKRFGGELTTEHKGTLLLNKYMSKNYQAELAQRLGLVEHIRFDPEFPDVNKNVKEDVFEAFFGCLNNLADDRIQEGFGYIYCYNLISVIFNEVTINLEEVRRDPKSLLKELYEKMGWGEPQYKIVNSDDPRQGPYLTEVRSRTGEVLGRAYGTYADAPFGAAVQALETLAQQGITREYADQQKQERRRRRNPALDLQYRRLEAAIKKLNEQATQAGKANVTDYKVTRIESHAVKGGHRYTYAVEVAYPTGDGKIVWHKLNPITGSDNEGTKIKVMKEFADSYAIPANI